MFTAVARKAKYFLWGNDAEKGTWFARVSACADALAPAGPPSTQPSRSVVMFSRTVRWADRNLGVGGTPSSGNAAGIPQHSLLLFIFAIPFFVLPFAVETLLLQARPALTLV